MGEFRVGLSRFDLSGFIGEIFDFLHRNDISPTVVVSFTQDGAAAESEMDEITQDSTWELLLRGEILFLPFSDINVGESIPCADGNSYSIFTSSGLDEEVAVSAEQVESVGFLVKVEQENIEICPAVFKGGDYCQMDPNEIEGDLKEFNEPMFQFVGRFMND